MALRASLPMVPQDLVKLTAFWEHLVVSILVNLRIVESLPCDSDGDARNELGKVLDLLIMPSDASLKGRVR